MLTPILVKPNNSDDVDDDVDDVDDDDHDIDDDDNDGDDDGDDDDDDVDDDVDDVDDVDDDDDNSNRWLVLTILFQQGTTISIELLQSPDDLLPG